MPPPDPAAQDARIRRQQEELAARRAAYEELRRLGTRRRGLERSLAQNTDEILAVVRSMRPNLDMSEASVAVGVARQTLYRWLNLSV
jgi:DNA invertase Pin-like site-specific DNA recombinase